MFALTPKNKMLDMRYHEMWNDWDGVDEPTDRGPFLCNGNSPDERVPELQSNNAVHASKFNGHVKPRTRLVLSWKRLNVTVKQTVQKFFKPSVTTYKQILYNVSGNVQSGTLLGIMGPSGSGKTTLMATISHRTKGNFDGELLLNGQPISEELMIKISGFVPQHDISFDQLTALEHLSLMANLKMDCRTTKSEMKDHLDYIISTIGMGKFLNTRISFLSGGERKKVALAVQMLNDPPILFCDEITTGLDSYSAAHIVNTLKGVARTGKIVVCTIHQPASGVFGKFDDVLLLSNGRLAYHGPVSMVHQLFEKFNYECPNMFNEADYVISILNSNNEKVKRDVDEMCKLSSTDTMTDDNFDLYNNQKQLDCIQIQHLQTKKPFWIRQFSLIFTRSLKCFLRSYPTKLLELGTILFLGLIIAAPFANLQFDTRAVQNWEGFWLMLVINCMYHFNYSTIPIYLVKFSIIHREIHNEVYPLSTYYVSELIIMSTWIITKMLVYCISAFTVVGVEWTITEIFIFCMIAFSAFSYGSLLSACFYDINNAFIFATIYDFIALPVSGAYLSFQSLPKVFYFLRHFSLFFLGCEMASILFWEKILYLPCDNEGICLNNGKAVLNKYGYIISEYNLDLTILISFCVLANIIGYFGVLKKMRKQPAY